MLEIAVMENGRGYTSTTVESVSIRWGEMSRKRINATVIGVKFLIQDAVVQQDNI